MKTSMVLIFAVLAGSTAFATGETSSTQYNNSHDAQLTSDRQQSAYDSAIKPDRTMRHTTREGRASNDYNNQNDVDRSSWDRDGNHMNQTPDTHQ